MRASRLCDRPDKLQLSITFGATSPPTRGSAFDTAQRAFANGWIDLEDLDQRLALIAHAPDEETTQQAVTDLKSMDKRVTRQPEAAPRQRLPERTPAGKRARKGGRTAADVVFGTLLLAFVSNLLVWGIIAVTEGSQYFWPVWMMIP